MTAHPAGCRPAIGALALTLLVVAPAAHAGAAEERRAERRALLLLRALAYDQNLDARGAGNELHIAVTYTSGSLRSTDAAQVFAAELEKLASATTVKGKRLRIHLVDADEPAAVPRELARCKPIALFLAPGVTPSPVLLAEAGEAHALTVGEGREAAALGVTLSFVERGDRVGLLVNRSGAAREHVRFDAALLKVVEVQEDPAGATAASSPAAAGR